jgi:hypothetical protein
LPNSAGSRAEGQTLGTAPAVFPRPRLEWTMGKTTVQNCKQRWEWLLPPTAGGGLSLGTRGGWGALPHCRCSSHSNPGGMGKHGGREAEQAPLATSDITWSWSCQGRPGPAGGHTLGRSLPGRTCSSSSGHTRIATRQRLLATD